MNAEVNYREKKETNTAARRECWRPSLSRWKSAQLICLHSAGVTEGKNLSAYDYTVTSGVVSRRKFKSVTHFWILYSYHIFLHNNRNDEAETHAWLNETFADLSSLAGVTKNRQRTEKPWRILIKFHGTSPVKERKLGFLTEGAGGMNYIWLHSSKVKLLPLMWI